MSFFKRVLKTCQKSLFTFSHCSKSSFFVQKFNFDFLRSFWVKNSWKCCGFGLFSCWQLWFHEKIVKKIWEKNSWKCWGFVKIEFLDKNLTFRIVWSYKTLRINPSEMIMPRENALPKSRFTSETSLTPIYQITLGLYDSLWFCISLNAQKSTQNLQGQFWIQ